MSAAGAEASATDPANGTMYEEPLSTFLTSRALNGSQVGVGGVVGGSGELAVTGVVVPGSEVVAAEGATPVTGALVPIAVAVG